MAPMWCFAKKRYKTFEGRSSMTAEALIYAYKQLVGHEVHDRVWTLYSKEGYPPNSY